MQEHLILCDDKAVRSPETCCPEASWLEENPLRPSNWLKLVFTEVRRKFAMTSTEAKPAEVHTYLLCSVGSPQRFYPSYIHEHAAIRGTSDPHIAQSPVSFIFCFKKKKPNKHNPQNIHIHLHLKTDKTRMHSVCTQHLWGNKYSLFPQNWPLKAGSGEKGLRKANTAGSAASLQAKLSPARWQPPGCPGFWEGALPLVPSMLPAHPALSSSGPSPERGWNCYLSTEKIQFWWSAVFQGHVEIIPTRSPCSSNTEKPRN